MKNVTLSQSNTLFTGITQSEINTTSVNFGYYQVPLAIRNEKYPDEFKTLPSGQVLFPLIDDEVPLHLGDKIDYKDYINFSDDNGNTHFAIVNPVSRNVLQTEGKYAKIGQSENGIVIPPPAGITNTSVTIPEISISSNSISNEISLSVQNTPILIPVIIPIVAIGSTYQFLDTVIPSNSTVQFNLVQYKGIFTKEIKLAAVNVRLASVDE
ncbi:MAG: hypothetical protein KDD32_03195 [Bacteroidetes bacterium]|nr:hypothetical protein [Bacteroidota bacterium]